MNNDQAVVKSVIQDLTLIGVDGETMQYILEQVGMDEQMAIQLSTKYYQTVAEHLHELKEEGLI